MFLSMNWISDFVDFTGLDKVDLIHRFSLSTAEVENEIFFKGSDISGIVVAEIKSVENHPDSKKLHLLKVDAGDGELTDVVCGAPNVRVGLKTAFAKVALKSAILRLHRESLQALSQTVCVAVKAKSVFLTITAVLWKLQTICRMVPILSKHIRLTISFLRLIINLLQTVPTFGVITVLPVNLLLLQAENLNRLKPLI